MSPEQLQSQTEQVDMRSDVWALGTILYELLIGQPVFPGGAAPAICAQILGDKPLPKVKASRPELPEVIDTILAGCLERDPARRTPNVAVLAGQLLDVLGVPSEQIVARLSAMIERRPGGPGGATLLSGSYPSTSSLGLDTLGRPSSSSSSSRIPVSSPSMPTVAGGAALSTPPPGATKATTVTAPKIAIAVVVVALLGGAYWLQRAPSSGPQLASSVASLLPAEPPPAPVVSSAPSPPENSAPTLPVASATTSASPEPPRTAEPTRKDPRSPRPPPPTRPPPPSGKGNVLDERL